LDNDALFAARALEAVYLAEPGGSTPLVLTFMMDCLFQPCSSKGLSTPASEMDTKNDRKLTGLISDLLRGMRWTSNIPFKERHALFLSLRGVIAWGSSERRTRPPVERKATRLMQRPLEHSRESCQTYNPATRRITGSTGKEEAYHDSFPCSLLFLEGEHVRLLRVTHVNGVRVLCGERLDVEPFLVHEGVIGGSARGVDGVEIFDVMHDK